MAEELKFYKWIHNAQSNFFFVQNFIVDFSRQAGDFSFKLVASSKILVAMVTKVVVTWRVVQRADCKISLKAKQHGNAMFPDQCTYHTDIVSPTELAQVLQNLLNQ